MDVFVITKVEIGSLYNDYFQKASRERKSCSEGFFRKIILLFESIKKNTHQKTYFYHFKFKNRKKIITTGLE